jgi:tol-pal system protein YbgF
MKRFALKPGMFLLSVVALWSCAYDKDMAYLNDQVIALNRRVAKIEEGTDTKISTIRTSQGDTRVEIDNIRGEMQKLQGRVEDNERITRRAVERDLGDQDSVKKGLADLSRRFTDLEATVKSQQDYLGLESSGQKGPATAPTSPAEARPQTPPAPVVPAEPPKPKDVELYDRSLALFKEGKHEEAIQSFKDFLKKYPKSDRADNALFWVGESYFALKQYEQAILTFNDVIKNYPKGNKVPSALLRQSLAFVEINDKTSARLLLRKIIKDYPNSSEAKIAAKKLETLK